MSYLTTNNLIKKLLSFNPSDVRTNQYFSFHKLTPPNLFSHHHAAVENPKSDGLRTERPRWSGPTPPRRPDTPSADAGASVWVVFDLLQLFHVFLAAAAATAPTLTRGQRAQPSSTPPPPLLPSTPADSSQGSLSQRGPRSTHGIPEHPRIYFPLDFSN